MGKGLSAPRKRGELGWHRQISPQLLIPSPRGLGDYGRNNFSNPHRFVTLIDPAAREASCTICQLLMAIN